MSSSDISTAKYRLGFVLVALAAVLFAAKGIFIKLAYAYQVDPTTLLTLRMLLSLPVYLGLLLYLQRISPSAPVMTVGTGFTVTLLGLASYYAAALLDMMGLQYISANLERILIYLYPTMVVILGAIFLGTRITLRIVLSMLIAYAGTLLVFAADFQQSDKNGTVVYLGLNLPFVVAGSLLTLASALCFAVYVTFSENYIRQLGSVRFTCYAMLAASAAIIIHFGSSHPITDLVQPTPVYILAGCIAVFSTLVPSFLMSEGISRVGSPTAGIISTLGPGATLIIAYLVLDEPMTLQNAIGVAIVAFSVYLLSRCR